MSRRVTRTQYEALAAFHHRVRQFLRIGEESAVEAGLTPQQYAALLAIKGFPGRDCVSVGELAERLQVRHHSVVGLVDRLVSQNLVERQYDDEDRRHVYVALTRHGSELLERSSAISADQVAELRHWAQELIEVLHRIADTPRVPRRRV